MKVWIVGALGQLGRALVAGAPATWEIHASDRETLDISDAQAVARAMDAGQPAVVINAAAYTRVDQAELEPELAQRVNVDGPRHLAEACAAHGARLIHVSTDFVFDGSAGSPYAPDAVTRPLSVYGVTKRDGEVQVAAASGGAALTVRTAWVYDKRGPNFVLTMLRLMRERDEVRVVSDQVGAPTRAGHLARAIVTMCERTGLRGVVHFTDAGVASWYDFAVAIQEEAYALGLLNRCVPIRPITSAEYPTPASRPAYSVLDTTATYRALDLDPVHWRVALRAELTEVVDSEAG